MIKLLLYCCKAKPYITISNDKQRVYPSCVISDGIKEWHLNGKIVAECDFEVEKIELKDNSYEAWFATETLNEEQLREKSCLRLDELYNYLEPNAYGYAIHIKNLHIFDEPKELNYYHFAPHLICLLEKAPQNMQYIYDYKGVKKVMGGYEDDFEKKVLISIQPQWMCKILNGEKTIEVRKKVLREMIK